MDDAKIKQNLKEWVESLSSETVENLKIVLSAAIPVTEIWGRRGYDLIPLRAFSFSQKGVSDGVAIMLLESIGEKTNSEIKEVYHNNIDAPALCISIGETTKILKIAQQIITEKSAKEKMKQERNEPIHRIICIKPARENEKFKIIINDKYELLVRGSVHKNAYWEQFLTLGENQSIPYHRGFFNYFNSNPQNPIRHLPLQKTQLLKKEDYAIKPNVIIKTQKRSPNKSMMLKPA